MKKILSDNCSLINMAQWRNKTCSHVSMLTFYLAQLMSNTEHWLILKGKKTKANSCACLNIYIPAMSFCVQIPLLFLSFSLSLSLSLSLSISLSLSLSLSLFISVHSVFLVSPFSCIYLRACVSACPCVCVYMFEYACMVSVVIKNREMFEVSDVELLNIGGLVEYWWIS